MCINSRGRLLGLWIHGHRIKSCLSNNLHCMQLGIYVADYRHHYHYFVGRNDYLNVDFMYVKFVRCNSFFFRIVLLPLTLYIMWRIVYKYNLSSYRFQLVQSHQSLCSDKNSMFHTSLQSENGQNKLIWGCQCCWYVT
jgi:hypothetical protein